MRDIRISIAVIVTLLISLGITMIYSSSGIYALQELGDKTYFLSRHLLFLLIGLMAVLCVMAFDYRDLRAAAKPPMSPDFTPSLWSAIVPVVVNVPSTT